MAEEDDDDESFGDFTFAPFPNQSFPSTSNHDNPTAADDDWGDFVNHSNQINGGSSKPFDPFGASIDPTEKHVNDNNGIAVQANKPRGAIPLSIFGEEDKDEEEEEEPGSANAFFYNKSNGGGAVKRGSDSNGSVGIDDLLSNLYNQQPRVNSQNGSASVSNVAAPNPNADGPMNSNVNDSNPDSDDEDGWEFKSAEWETGNKSHNVKVEMPKHDNGAVGVGALLDSSNGISDKAGEWHLGFEFSSSSVSHSWQPGPKSESNETGTGLTMFDQNFGKLKNAHSWPGPDQTLEAPKKAEIYPTSIEVLKYDGGASHSTIDLSLASESHQSDGWDFGFNFNSSSLGECSSHISESHFKTKSNQDENNKSNASPRTPTNINVVSDVNLFESKDGEGSHVSESYFKTKSNQDENNKGNASLTNINVDSDVNLFESKDAVTEIGTKHEKLLMSSENRREALPLSIFGDEMPDTNEHSVSQDLSPHAPISPIQNNFNSPGSNLSINDLIWNLYNQAENKNSPNMTPKASENQIHASPEISGSNLVDSDDFDDDFGDFMDASPGTRIAQESAQKTSFNHAPHVNENGLPSSLAVLSSDVINGNDGFENDSWEFKDAVSGTRSRDQASSIDHRDLLKQLSTELEPTDCVEFFSKLKDELCNDVLFHLQNLKKAQYVAALSGEDAKANALEVEVQEFSEILHQDNMSIPYEFLSENFSPRNVNFNELLEVLKEPKFQPLESEYQLASKLSMAEKDMKSAMELLKDAVSTLRILKLGSREEQSNYLTIWSKIGFVCSQELKHGAYIWKQAVQKNVHDQILSNPKGVQYIHALGEIYRAAEIIGASAKLHKPWMLSGLIDPTRFFALLNECYSLWLASGLEEALFNISNQNNFDSDDISRELVESIKYVRELDEQALQSYIISGEETTCQLSALPAGCIPGLNLVTWNGKHYFVKLANLWVNLISSDPPKK